VRGEDENSLIGNAQAHAASAHDMDLTEEFVRELLRTRRTGPAL
jgi:hypothetical protein